MGRRRRRVIRVFRRTLPKIFMCPNCGTSSIRVAREDGAVKVTCGSCGISWETNTERPLEPIDIYNKFVDQYHKGALSSQSV